MLGKHCIKTWSSTQGAVALSSAEAEFYAMIEAIVRAKGVLNVIRRSDSLLPSIFIYSPTVLRPRVLCHEED